jgi:hypothetical protein
MTRYFPAPWSVDDIGGCFVVKASNDQHRWYSSITGKVPPADPWQGY